MSIATHRDRLEVEASEALGSHLELRGLAAGGLVRVDRDAVFESHCAAVELCGWCRSPKHRPADPRSRPNDAAEHGRMLRAQEAGVVFDRVAAMGSFWLKKKRQTTGR